MGRTGFDTSDFVVSGRFQFEQPTAKRIGTSGNLEWPPQDYGFCTLFKALLPGRIAGMDTEQKPPVPVVAYFKKVWRKAREIEGREWLAIIGGELMPTIAVTLLLCALLGYGVIEQLRLDFIILLGAIVLGLLVRMGYCFIRACAAIDAEQSSTIAKLNAGQDDRKRRTRIGLETLYSSIELGHRIVTHMKETPGINTPTFQSYWDERSEDSQKWNRGVADVLRSFASESDVRRFFSTEANGLDLNLYHEIPRVEYMKLAGDIDKRIKFLCDEILPKYDKPD